MKTVIHTSDSRGHADHGWLTSHHTFSFGGYQNPNRMHFGALRVLNDDIVKPKMGFGTHPHQNMEIISIPLKGALSHKDSMGNKRAIEVGEVQVMSAGTGLTHSEFNDSKTDTVNFLQLWIVPEAMNVKPNYEQRSFNATNYHNTLHTIVAPKDKLQDNALPISQQAYIYRSDLDADTVLSLQPKVPENGMYIFTIEGGVSIANHNLKSRDAIGVWAFKDLQIQATENSKLLIVEVPMIELN